MKRAILFFVLCLIEGICLAQLPVLDQRESYLFFGSVKEVVETVNARQTFTKTYSFDRKGRIQSIVITANGNEVGREIYNWDDRASSVDYKSYYDGNVHTHLVYTINQWTSDVHAYTCKNVERNQTVEVECRFVKGSLNSIRMVENGLTSVSKFSYRSLNESYFYSVATGPESGAEYKDGSHFRISAMDYNFRNFDSKGNPLNYTTKMTKCSWNEDAVGSTTEVRRTISYY